MRFLRQTGCCCCWLASLSLGVLFAQDLGDGAGDGRSTGEGGLPGALPAGFIRPVAPARQDPWIQPGNRRGVDWTGLAWQSSLFLGVEHAFRLATEPGTREGLKGPFFSGWWRSAGNLHGWSDGDPFYVNYVGHPMQGAVTGFIWSHNDRDFQGAEFGRNSYYWKSRLRAAAFSWAYSTMFEIGPLSEASIGKVQSVYPQQGFVDHVITPVVGTGWMITEDALDKYVIQRFEERVQSPVLRILVRGALNPSRSFANAMRLKVPWARDDRPGAYSPLLTSYLDDRRAGLIRAPQLAPKELEGEFGLSSLEVSMNARPQAIGGRLCAGGGGEGAFRLAPSWQFVIDVSGCKMMDLPQNYSGDTLTYLAGPRWSARPVSRWNPYAHFLMGGMKVTEQKTDPELRAVLVAAAAKDGSSAAADFAKYAQTWEANGFAVAAGTGLDLRLNPALALKIAAIEYRRAWLPPINGRDYNSGLAFTVGAQLRMGTW
jgi:hypothetical protein